MTGQTSDADLRALLPARRDAEPGDLFDVVPDPGRAVLACRCGRALDLNRMHRRRDPLPGGHPIARITCLECAT